MATQYHEQARRYGKVTPHLGFKEIATFFGICVWLAPLFLFLSLSANDNALPTSSSSGQYPRSKCINSVKLTIG